MTEDDLLTTVLDLAKLHNWRAFHPMPAINVRGRWLTAYRGDGGFVDLCLARGGVVKHVELKSQTGRLGPGQPEWAAAIGDSHRLWRPSDLPAIAQELR